MWDLITVTHRIVGAGMTCLLKAEVSMCYLYMKTNPMHVQDAKFYENDYNEWVFWDKICVPSTNQLTAT